MIVDGGLGVELARRGFVFTTSLWSGEAVLTRPDLLQAIHRAYLAAGAHMLETATYQMSHHGLRALGYDDHGIDAIFARAIALTREAIAAHVAQTHAAGPYVVAASLGPYGATLGDGSEFSAVQHLGRDALYAFHAERAHAVARASPDIFLFETIPTRTESLVVAEVARDLGLAPAWLLLSCADGARTFGGDAVRDVMREIGAFDAVTTVGVNCTAPAAIAPLVREIQCATTKPIVVCPNLGQHWESASHELIGATDEDELLRLVPEWLALGVAHIGGCCGVGPRTIAAIGAAYDTYAIAR